MTLQINMLPGFAVNGGIGAGVLSAAGNPWAVADGLARELVNRGVATAFNWPLLAPAQTVAANYVATQVQGADGSMHTILPGNPYEVQATAGAAASGAVPGAIMPMAPIPVPVATRTVDCMAFWYADMGLAYTREVSSEFIGWYDNRGLFKSTNGLVTTTVDSYGKGPFPNGQGYFPERLSILGHYHMDDRTSLSWLVKWMVDAGCSGAVLQQRVLQPDNGGTWATRNDPANWIYQLHQLPAIQAGALKLAYWLPYGDSPGAASPTNGSYDSGTAYTTGQTVINGYYDSRQYRALASTTNQQPNAYPGIWQIVTMPAAWGTINAFNAAHQASAKLLLRKGKNYLFYHMHEAELFRSGVGAGTWSYWLKELAADIKTKVPAWDGVAIHMRNGGLPNIADGVTYGNSSAGLDYDDLEAAGVLVLRGDYNGTVATARAATATNYAALIDAFQSYASSDNSLAPNRRAHCVPTALHTIAPHPSNYVFRYSTPELFSAYVTKVLQTIKAGQGYPLVMIYGCGEQYEGGACLWPDQLYGFGYGNALRQALTT